MKNKRGFSFYVFVVVLLGLLVGSAFGINVVNSVLNSS